MRAVVLEIVGGVVATGCGRLAFDPASDAGAGGGGDAAGDAAAGGCVPGLAFGTPRLIAELSTGAPAGTLRLLDANRGYYWSMRTRDNDLYFVSRVDGGSPWRIEVMSGGLNTSSNEVDPSVTSDGQLLLDRQTGPLVAALSGPSSDTQPSLQPGGVEVYFASTRSSSARAGTNDVYVATRGVP